MEVAKFEEIYSYLKCKICDGYFENAKILPSCFQFLFSLYFTKCKMFNTRKLLHYL